jgi:1-acyl-sn-glycerol-3-phosphate acyltransferase
MPNRLDPLWWWGSYTLVHLLMSLAFSMRLRGRRNIPRTGPVLVAANHQSFFDPILVGLASPRPLYFLARRTLFQPGWFGKLISTYHAVPVDQEGVAKEGLRTILKLLEQGEAAVVFPEGTRTPDGKMSPLRPGIQLLLRRAGGVPVVPVGLAGAFEALPYWRPYPILSPLFFPRNKAAVAVVVGKPLDGRRLATLERGQLLKELDGHLHRLRTEAEHLRGNRNYREPAAAPSAKPAV